MTQEELRNKLLDLKKPDKLASKQPIEAELDDIVKIITQANEQSRIDELERTFKTIGGEYDPMGWYSVLEERLDKLGGKDE